MGARLPRGDGGEQDNVLRQGKADGLDTPADTLHKKVRGKEWAKHS